MVWRTKNKPVLLMLRAACDGHYGNENWEFNADVLDTDELPASTI